ncbi:MAG: C69 family dipeptidase [Thermofilaceae archaeon]
MDMLRIALERSTNAGEALSWIINLLEEYGQGGNCSATGKLYYHNSFIIADPHEAWVLETVGKFWVAEKVKDVRSISNALSIEKSWQMASEGVVEYAVEHGWCRDENDFSFAKCYSDRFYTTMAKGRYRQRFTQNALERRRGEIDFPTAAGIMRSHSFQEGYSPAKGSMKDVCMHAGGLTRPSQTAGSIIAILYEQCPVIWVTGTSSPCISLYKPFFFEAGLPDLGPKPSGRYDTESYWWRHEKLHRSLLYSYPSYVASIGSEINVIEADLVKRAEQLRLNYLDGKVSINELASLTRQAFEIGASIDEKWTSSIKPGKGLNPAYATYWFKVNRAAGL